MLILMLHEPRSSRSIPINLSFNYYVYLFIKYHIHNSFIHKLQKFVFWLILFKNQLNYNNDILHNAIGLGQLLDILL